MIKVIKVIFPYRIDYRSSCQCFYLFHEDGTFESHLNQNCRHILAHEGTRRRFEEDRKKPWEQRLQEMVEIANNYRPIMEKKNEEH